MLTKITEEYLQDVLVRLTHSSCNRKGNKISLNEIVSILIYRMVSNEIKVSFFYEIDNHGRVFKRIINYINSNENLTVEIIQEIHDELVKKTNLSKVEFTKERLVSLQKWLDRLESELKYENTKEDKLRIILASYVELADFLPSNEALRGIIINYLFLKNDLVPLIINEEVKEKHVKVLEQGSVEDLYKLSMPILEKERIRLQQFYNKISSRVLF